MNLDDIAEQLAGIRQAVRALAEGSLLNELLPLVTTVIGVALGFGLSVLQGRIQRKRAQRESQATSVKQAIDMSAEWAIRLGSAPSAMWEETVRGWSVATVPLVLRWMEVDPSPSQPIAKWVLSVLKDILDRRVRVAGAMDSVALQSAFTLRKNLESWRRGELDQSWFVDQLAVVAEPDPISAE